MVRRQYNTRRNSASPYTTFEYIACFFDNLLRRYIGALLHERAYGEPERVQQGELVLKDLGLPVARMGVLPLIGAEPADT